MYAIIADSGRQIRVQEGEVVQVDLRSDLGAGDKIEFDQVLACGEGESLKVGQPTVAGAKVTATVVDIEQGPKLVVQKLRRRKTFRKKTGHRQLFTNVKIEKISM